MTAKEFIESEGFEENIDTEELMIKFAKIHINVALKKASEIAELKAMALNLGEEIPYDEISSMLNEMDISIRVNTEEILSCYPLELIK